MAICQKQFDKMALYERGVHSIFVLEILCVVTSKKVFFKKFDCVKLVNYMCMIIVNCKV